MRPSLHTLLLLGSGVFAADRVVMANAPLGPAPAGVTSLREDPRPFHPEPRVIVNVTSVQGPHDPAKLQYAARLGWARIVRCYKASGSREKVVLTWELVVSSEGSVARARSLNRNPKYLDLATCLTEELQALAMPKAAAISTANVEIRLAPGDPSPPKAPHGPARLPPTVAR